MEKMSNERVGEYISMEGLEYAIKDGLSADEFEDKALAEMWRKAYSILSNIEIYLGEYIEYM